MAKTSTAMEGGNDCEGQSQGLPPLITEVRRRSRWRYHHFSIATAETAAGVASHFRSIERLLKRPQSTHSSCRLIRGVQLLFLLRLAWLIPLAVSLCACDGGGGSSTNPNGTPPGTYTLTVTATAGSTSQSVNRSAPSQGAH